MGPPSRIVWTTRGFDESKPHTNIDHHGYPDTISSPKGYRRDEVPMSPPLWASGMVRGPDGEDEDRDADQPPIQVNVTCRRSKCPAVGNCIEYERQVNAGVRHCCPNCKRYLPGQCAPIIGCVVYTKPSSDVSRCPTCAKWSKAPPGKAVRSIASSLASCCFFEKFLQAASHTGCLALKVSSFTAL